MVDDSEIIEQLPKEDIILDVSSVSDLCTSWNSKVNGLNLTGSRINNDFKALLSFGIVENYFICLATAVNSLTSTVNSICSSISIAKDAHIEADSKAKNSGVEKKQESKSDNHAGTSSKSNYSNQKTVVSKPKASTNLVAKGKLSLTSADDLSGIAMCLYKMKSEKINEINDIIMNDEYIELLKLKLLESPDISDLTKKLIENMDIDVLKQELKELSDKEMFEISMDDFLDVFSKYISSQAKMRNVSLDDLLNDQKESKELEEIVDDFCKVSDVIKEIAPKEKSDFRLNVLDTLKGNNPYNLSSENRDLINNLITGLAMDNDMTPEEYVTYSNINNDNNNMLSFLKTLINLDKDIIKKITSTFI